MVEFLNIDRDRRLSAVVAGREAWARNSASRNLASFPHRAEVAQLVEQPIRKLPGMSRVRLFCSFYAAYQGLNRHQSGVSGELLGKELGKEFSDASAPVFCQERCAPVAR
jgi:hypothetical protein